MEKELEKMVIEFSEKFEQLSESEKQKVVERIISDVKKGFNDVETLQVLCIALSVVAFSQYDRIKNQGKLIDNLTEYSEKLNERLQDYIIK